MNYKNTIIFFVVACLLTVTVMALRFEKIDEIPVIDCSETDGGMEPFIAGDVIAYPNSTVISDYCSGGLLYEYKCKPESHINKYKVDCPKGCSNGACVL